METVPRFNPKRIDTARLAANMSHADLAYAVRRITDGRLKPTEQSIRRWINGTHAPREGVLAAIAAATSRDIGFFYEADAEHDDEGRALLRDLRGLPTTQLPDDLRRRLERFIEPRTAIERRTLVEPATGAGAGSTSAREVLSR